MKNVIKKALLIITILIISYIVYLHTLYNYNFYSSLIEIQIPIFAKMEEKDTHGGFHGDGDTLAKVYFSNKQAQNFISNISDNVHWKELPMPEILEYQAYNTKEEGMEIPFIENGYWFFIDRYRKTKDKYDYNEMREQASFNYSLAIFDTDANILYVYSLDT